MKQLRQVKQTRKQSSIKDGIHDALDILIKTFYPKFHLKNLMRDITEAIWIWREGVYQDFLVHKAKKYLPCN
jgi:hypothetical protein